MKRFAIFLVVFSLILMGSIELALAEVALNANELIEKSLPKVVAENEKNKLSIEIEGQKYLIDIMPNPEKMKQALGLKIPDEIKREMRARGEKVIEPDPFESYKKLSQTKQRAFLLEREKFLIHAARVLKATEYGVGFGSLVGDAFTFVKVKTYQLFGKDVVPSESLQQSFKERSRLASEGILQSLDYKLWSQAPLVIDANEFGMQLQVGLVAVQGVRNHGAGGGEYLSMSLGYNKEAKAMVFEISHVTEIFDHSKAAVGVVGLNGFAGFLMSRRDLSAPTEVLKGQTFYPPALPAYSSVGPEFFSAGISTSIGFPPPPMADLLTWTDRFERRAVLRITVSPIMKGFVRVYVGDVAGSVKIMAFRVINVLKELALKVLPLQRRACSRVFSS